MTETLTYIIQMDSPDLLVKFGQTKNVKSRLATLSQSVPWAINVIALIRPNCESELKAKFAHDKVRGEWFRPSVMLQEWLDDAHSQGRLVKQVPVDQAYINAVIKPRIKEYLNGREPHNNLYGDLVCRVLNDMIPTLSGRENELSVATKHHVSTSMCLGYCPTDQMAKISIPSIASERQAA